MVVIGGREKREVWLVKWGGGSTVEIGGCGWRAREVGLACWYRGCKPVLCDGWSDA